MIIVYGPIGAGTIVVMGDYFEKPVRPRILAMGLAEQEIAIVTPLVGTLTVHTDGEKFRAEEFDALIATGSQYFDHNFFDRKLLFAPEPSPKQPAAKQSGVVLYGGDGPRFSRAETQHHPAQNLEVSAWANANKLEGLVKTSCTPGTLTGRRGVRA